MKKHYSAEIQAYYEALEKEKIELYEQYINNSNILKILNQNIQELKDNKYKKDDKDAKLHFWLWVGWLVGIVTSIALRVAGIPDLSLIFNVGAVAFLIPNLVGKILEFPHKKKYVAKKRKLREKINSIEDENKKISETLLEIKSEQTKALLTAKTNQHSKEFETLVQTIKLLKKRNNYAVKPQFKTETENEININ